MTVRECTALLAPVAVTLGVQIDAPTFRAYHRVLADIPAPLLQAACDAALTTPRAIGEPRFPTPATLRQWAEHARQAWMRAHPWEPCESCLENLGFVELTDERGYKRLTRCACWKAHQAKIGAAGMSTRLALPPAERETVEA